MHPNCEAVDALLADAGASGRVTLLPDAATTAALLGESRLTRASADLVRQATGQPIGGVAPVAHPAPLRTLIDLALRDHPQVWTGGGIPHAMYATTLAALMELTGGTPADVA